MELAPIKGSKIARAAGSAAYLQGVDLTSSNKANFIVKLPSGKIKSLSGECLGQVGINSNESHQ